MRLGDGLGFAGGIALVLTAGLLVAGCSGDDGATQDQLDRARAEGAKEARDKAQVNQLERQVARLRNQQKRASHQSPGGGAPAPAPAPSMGPAKTCGGGVGVGASSATSCDFAFNVAGEYGSNPGASSIRAYSPVTGQYYTMNCVPMSGWSAVYTGGSGAAVFIP